MDSETFNYLLERRLGFTRSVLGYKAQEYATNDDRLHNFKVAARVGNTTPKKALFNFMLKHLVSLMDFIDEPARATPLLIDEKIGDLINYLILLEALFKEDIIEKMVDKNPKTV